MTKEKFKIYQEIQFSGKTNMFDIKRVIQLSDYTLSREDCLDIMKNYETYESVLNSLSE